MALQDEIMKDMAKEIAKDIDDQVMRSALVDNGWIEVKFVHKSKEQGHAIREWCEINVKDFLWTRLGNYYVFSNKKDAEWFILRWI